jgi:hypothetical protein
MRASCPAHSIIIFLIIQAVFGQSSLLCSYVHAAIMLPEEQTVYNDSFLLVLYSGDAKLEFWLGTPTGIVRNFG